MVKSMTVPGKCYAISDGDRLDDPYFLTLGLDTYHRIQLKNIGYLTGKLSKMINSDEIVYSTKIRNTCQIQFFLARKKIWNC